MDDNYIQEFDSDFLSKRQHSEAKAILATMLRTQDCRNIVFMALKCHCLYETLMINYT